MDMENNNAVGCVRRSESPVRCPLPPKKRFRMTEDDAAAAIDEPEPNVQMAREESETSSQTTFESLPVELVMEIFSKLSHSDLKKARHVCHTWNSTVTARPLLKKMSYTVRRAPDSFKTLHSSTVPWEHINIRNCQVSKYPTWKFPDSLKTTLTSLTISECTFPWSWLVGILEQFESLKTLTLRKCHLDFRRDCEWVHRRGGQVLDEMVTSNDSVPDAAQDRSLTIKLELEGYAATNLFLNQLVKSSLLSRAALEISIPVSKAAETGFSRKLSVKRERKALIEFSKLVSACKLARSVRVAAHLTIGNISLDCRNITEEDGQNLIQMYKRASRIRRL